MAGGRKLRLSHGLEKSGRHDLNVRPPAPKAEGDANDTNQNGRFPELAETSSGQSSENGRNAGTDSPTELDLEATLAMIERLPLSDDEKAEAVRRLLAEYDS